MTAITISFYFKRERKNNKRHCERERSEREATPKAFPAV
jgi:hypothetical protein